MLAKVCVMLIQAYRLIISPWLPASCRFTPSCSVYAQQAIARHGVWHGGGLTLRRLLKCHPWGPAGFDPVPEKRE